MGLAMIPAWPLIRAAFSVPALSLLCLGAGAYLSGIPFFLLGEIDPKYHIIWHLFVVAGAGLHWFFTYFFILETDIGLDITDVASVATAFSTVLNQTMAVK